MALYKVLLLLESLKNMLITCSLYFYFLSQDVVGGRSTLKASMYAKWHTQQLVAGACCQLAVDQTGLE
jgi:hypothetical protein